MLSGIINLDKPAGLSSAAAVNRVKRLLPRGTKIGHAGTLDPFATGVLLLLVGRATRLCESLMGQPKQYLATIRLGATTPTDDPESPATPTAGASPVSLEQLQQTLPLFVGAIEQRPPIYSALKVDGRRAYDLARKGQDVALRPRIVQVYGIELLEYRWPDAVVRIDCGRGTYIRSIARDVGERLGVGGYLTTLRRTRSGEFSAEQSVPLDKLLAEGVANYLCAVAP